MIRYFPAAPSADTFALEHTAATGNTSFIIEEFTTPDDDDDRSLTSGAGIGQRHAEFGVADRAGLDDLETRAADFHVLRRVNGYDQ